MACDGLGQNKIVRVDKNSGPLLNRLWIEVHENLRQCRRLFVLSNALARLFMSRFVQQIQQATKSLSRRKTEQVKKVCWPLFFSRRTTPKFLRQTVSAIYHPPFGKVWFSFVSWCPSAKPGNEVKRRIYVGWVKWRSSLKPFVDQSSCCFEAM